MKVLVAVRVHVRRVLREGDGQLQPAVPLRLRPEALDPHGVGRAALHLRPEGTVDFSRLIN